MFAATPASQPAGSRGRGNQEQPGRMGHHGFESLSLPSS